ncbi:ATP-binding protein [Frigidibacter sp. ROC022]|uniref:ATP-binding protein n=1 Tax=Frigidibacter sp. ROC022 TaxID=2971796 RepID=UPI00215A5EA5|nr:ATP-binding protein [Frigidibacter sp. ROC022]MCR8725379.1 ATP-binding protein [Frigidibacter sp. ROC022]
MKAARSLELRIAVTVGIAVTLLWVAAATLTWRLLDDEMNQLFDRDLKNTAQRILPLVLRDEGHDRPRDEDREEEDREEHDGDRKGHDHELVERLGDEEEYVDYVIRNRSGDVLLASAGADPAQIPDRKGEGFLSTASHRIYFAQAADGRLRIAVAEPLDHRRSVARGMQIWLALPLLVVIPLTLAAILLAVRRSLRPVAGLRQALEARGPRNLGPVDAAELPTELQPIAQGANSLLARLRAAFEAERSFAANAAHELRTPIAGAIAQAQRLKTETGDKAAAERAGEIETVLKRLNVLSVRLMQLARAEGSRLRTGTATDMVPVLRMIADDFGHGDDADRIQLHLPEGEVLSDLDPDAFGILCRNLIENALRHGAAGAPVDIRFTGEGVLTVENDGPVIPPADLERLTQRFQRRAESGEGSGLGLAIVRTIAERADGVLSLVSPVPGRAGGLSVRFELPHADAAGDKPSA